jgi:hypothetical protein
MAWLGVVLFTAIGIYLIIRRRESAKGQSLFVGSTVLPGCIVAEGVVFILLAVAFLVLHMYGIL